METNVLYYGDNLEILSHRNESGDHDYFPDESVDLVYLDPPFNSQQSYNILFKEQDTSWSPAQIKAFGDTWHWGPDTEATYRDLLLNAPRKVAQLLSALIGEPEHPGGIGRNAVTAYLVMMTARLIELHRVLKPTGSLFLHCDPTMSHYIKLVLDQIFGPTRFRNEIMWKRFSGHGNVYRSLGRIHDILLFYSKGDKWTWNQEYRPLSESYIESFFRYVEPGTVRRYRLQNVLNPNKNRPNLTYEWNGHVRVWKWTKEKMQQLHDAGLLVYSKTGLIKGVKQYLDESMGEKLHDLWDDIRPIGQTGDANLGYETQKPLALLERIIRIASNEGDVVLDPFCGCGTALVAAHKLDRRWIGIDITHLAIAVMKRRLQDHFPRIQVKAIGEPVDFPSAKALAKQNRYQFQWWALDLIDARPLGEKKKGADKGMDGVIPFTDDGGGKLKRVIVQVKSGRVGVKDIRELTAVAADDPIGVLLTLEPPTQPMETEAAKAGFYHSPLWQKRFAKIQILTIEEALAGKRPDMPTSAPLPKAPSFETVGRRGRSVKGEALQKPLSENPE